MHIKHQPKNITNDTETPAKLSVEVVEVLSPMDLDALCDVTVSVIEKSGGFGWQQCPARHVLERFWQGVMAVPERHLIVARMDNMICGAVQMVEPSRHNEMQAFAAHLLGCFVAPWADNYAVAETLLQTAEDLVAEKGFNVVNIDVQETETQAKETLELMGYVCWGVHPHYAHINGHITRGLFYTKLLHTDFVSFRENRDDMFLRLIKD